MKHGILSITFALLFSTIVVGQSTMYWKPEFKANAKAFMKYLDTFTNLNYNFKRLYKKNKGRFLFKKNYIPNNLKFKNYKYLKYSFEPVGANPPVLSTIIEYAPTLNGFAHIVLENNRPFLVWGSFGLLNRFGLESDDSTIYKKLDVDIDCKNCVSKNRGMRTTFYRYFMNTDSTEKLFLLDLLGSSNSKLILEEYCRVSGEVVVFKQKENLEDYKGFSNPLGFFNSSTQPCLSYISKQFPVAEYYKYFKLIYSKSPIFNWFMAEFLNYNNSKFNFLTIKEKEEIYNYNGKNGFVKFRNNDVLAKFYQ